MTIKQLLLQEIENTPNELLKELLGFLKSLKATPEQPLATYRELLERIDYLETIVGIRKGLDEFEQGEGIPAEQALATLQHKLGFRLAHELPDSDCAHRLSRNRNILSLDV